MRELQSTSESTGENISTSENILCPNSTSDNVVRTRSGRVVVPPDRLNL